MTPVGRRSRPGPRFRGGWREFRGGSWGFRAGWRGAAPLATWGRAMDGDRPEGDSVERASKSHGTGARVHGVVLCGGRSSRFGADKALAPVPTLDGRGTTSLLERTLDLLRLRCERIVVATGSRARYADRLAARPEAVPVTDRAPDLGPLAGLEAGLAACDPEAEVLVVSCDLPRLDVAALDALLAGRRDQAVDVCLWHDGRAHPLLGCYRAAVLPALRAALDGGERRLVAFHGAPLEPRRCDETPQGGPEHAAGARDGSRAAPRVRVGYVRRDGEGESGPAANANSRDDLERLLRGASDDPRAPRSAQRRTP